MALKLKIIKDEPKSSSDITDTNKPILVKTDGLILTNLRGIVREEEGSRAFIPSSESVDSKVLQTKNVPFTVEKEPNAPKSDYYFCTMIKAREMDELKSMLRMVEKIRAQSREARRASSDPASSNKSGRKIKTLPEMHILYDGKPILWSPHKT